MAAGAFMVTCGIIEWDCDILIGAEEEAWDCTVTTVPGWTEIHHRELFLNME